jgi:rare lipoprotein A
MVRARPAIRWALSGLCVGCFVLPTAAGAKLTGTNPTGGTSAPSAAPAPVAAQPTSTGGALAVTPSTVLQHQIAVVSGSVPVADAGQRLWLEVRQRKGGWVAVLSAAAAADGSFVISWPANRAGQLTLRVVSATVASTSAVSATPVVTLSVYRQIVATWYGPGFYGNRTACGEKLTRHIVGVADRTLPCGTPVTVRYGGQTLTAPVIDRGPYANGVTLDLTHAAAQELGMTETVNVEILVLSGPPLAPTDWFAPGSSPIGATGATGPALVGGATAPSG